MRLIRVHHLISGVSGKRAVLPLIPLSDCSDRRWLSLLGLVLSGNRQQLWPYACCLLAPQDPLCVTGVPGWGVTLQFGRAAAGGHWCVWALQQQQCCPWRLGG